MLVQQLQNKFSKTNTKNSIDPVQFVSNPLSNIPKEELPLVNFWETSSNVRGSQYLLSLHSLFLDYDDMLTIEQFQRRYWKFEHYIYTTSSHTTKHHKFRVIVPLSSPISASNYNSNVRSALESIFPYCDKTAFYSDHAFFVPCKNDNTEYIYKINSGVKKFDIRKIDSVILANQMSKAMITPKVYNNNPTINTPNRNVVIDSLQTIVNQSDNTGRYDSLFKLVYKYKLQGVDRRDVVDGLADYKNSKQIMKGWV